jgi:hypothetical protein
MSAVRDIPDDASPCPPLHLAGDLFHWTNAVRGICEGQLPHYIYTNQLEIGASDGRKRKWYLGGRRKKRAAVVCGCRRVSSAPVSGRCTPHLTLVESHEAAAFLGFIIFFFTMHLRVRYVISWCSSLFAHSTYTSLHPSSRWCRAPDQCYRSIPPVDSEFIVLRALPVTVFHSPDLVAAYNFDCSSSVSCVMSETIAVLSCTLACSLRCVDPCVVQLDRP